MKAHAALSLSLVPISLVPFSLVLAGCADNSPGGKQAQARHGRFEEIGDAFKTVNDEVKSGAPNFAAIKAATARIVTLAPQVKDWFPAGSGPQDGTKTDAKAEIWTRPGEFQQAATRFVDAANALQAAVETGDTASIGATARTLGGACKNCHDRFRED